MEETQEVTKQEVPVKGVAAIKTLFDNVEPRIAGGTPAHNPAKKSGKMLTAPRKAEKAAKKARKTAKRSRRINRGK